MNRKTMMAASFVVAGLAAAPSFKPETAGWPEPGLSPWRGLFAAAGAGRDVPEARPFGFLPPTHIQ